MHSTFTKASQKSMTLLSWRCQITIGVVNGFSQAFTDVLVGFGLHCGLVGFGFLQLNCVLCLNVWHVLVLLRGK